MARQVSIRTTPTQRVSPVSGGEAERRALTNRLLAVLPRDRFRRLLASGELITLPFGKVLLEPGEPIKHVYFPAGCLISMLTTIEGHLAREVGLVGREGMVGIPLALGVKVSPVRALVQGEGTCLRVTAARFRSEYAENGSFRRAVNQYMHELMVQIAQTAACNVSHPVGARLARWLLMTRDRIGTDSFLLTQELLSSMLGVLRAAVTRSAGTFQQRKLIRYTRGKISILDGRRLEAAACICYQVVKPAGSKRQTR